MCFGIEFRVAAAGLWIGGEGIGLEVCKEPQPAGINGHAVHSIGSPNCHPPTTELTPGYEFYCSSLLRAHVRDG